MAQYTGQNKTLRRLRSGYNAVMSRGEDNRYPPQIREDRDAEAIAIALAVQHQVDYVDLRFAFIPDHVIDFVPRSIAIEHLIIPFAKDAASLVVITSDPSDSANRDKLCFILNHEIRFAVAPRTYIEAALIWYYP